MSGPGNRGDVDVEGIGGIIGDNRCCSCCRCRWARTSRKGVEFEVVVSRLCNSCDEVVLVWPRECLDGPNRRRGMFDAIVCRIVPTCGQIVY